MKFILKAFFCTYVMSVSGLIHAQNIGSEDNDKLEEIVVTGTDQSRYRVSQKGTLTGLPLDFLELPRIVHTIPEQLVLDRKITDLQEALRNTPGVSESDGFGGTSDDFLIRGFRRNVVYRNGFRRSTFFKTNMTNVALTQVVRGPASITYGQVQPGGLVDIVTKKPLDERRIAGEARMGSFNDRQLLVDWSEPLNDSVSLRVVASTQDAETFRDQTDISRDALAISGKFVLSDNTQFDVSYEYRSESRTLDRGTLTVPTPNGLEIISDVLDIPIERRFGEAYDVSKSKFEFFEASMTQNLGDNWKLRLGVAKEKSLADDYQASALASVIVDEGESIISADGFYNSGNFFTNRSEGFVDNPNDQVFLVRRLNGSLDRDIDVTYLNVLLNGEIETGNFSHRVAIGVDYLDRKDSRFFISNGLSLGERGGFPLFNVSNPNFGATPLNLSLDGVRLLEGGNKEHGIFINDYVDLTDKFSLLVGLRYDKVDIDTNSPTAEFDAFSPQVAVNYKLNEATSIFTSYSKSFRPNSGRDPLTGDRLIFDPEDANQIEIGLKATFFDGKLKTTAAIYKIEKTNVLSVEDDVVFLRDGQTSDGIELAISGQPIQGMNVAAGYAYNDSELEDEGVDGNRPKNVAKNTFNLWTSYEWQAGPLKSLGMGAGIFHSSDRFAETTNTFNLGSYTLADASVWYTLKIPGGDGFRTARLQIAGKNLLDEEYITAAGGSNQIILGTPRSVIASVSLDF